MGRWPSGYGKRLIIVGSQVRILSGPPELLTMKIELQDTGGYKLFVEIRPLPTDHSQHELKFTTIWEGARGAVEEHNQAQFFLSDRAVAKFKELLNGY